MSDCCYNGCQKNSCSNFFDGSVIWIIIAIVVVIWLFGNGNGNDCCSGC